MSPEDIAIKGIREGLLIVLNQGDWSTRQRALKARLDASPSFFKGGRVALDIGPQQLSRSQIEGVRDLLTFHQVELWGLVSTDPTTKTTAEALGLQTEIQKPKPVQPAPPREHEDQEASELPFEGLVVRRTLRSGQSLRHPGHVVVIGDVNPGAEVVAGGDIVVWGKLAGTVHAGALGDDGAIICSLDLAPTQLRIGGHIARPPEERQRSPLPEMASVVNGQIVAAPWQQRGWGKSTSLGQV